jgi:hypothetical protein
MDLVILVLRVRPKSLKVERTAGTNPTLSAILLRSRLNTARASAGWRRQHDEISPEHEVRRRTNPSLSASSQAIKYKDLSHSRCSTESGQLAIGAFVDALERNHAAAINRIAPSHTGPPFKSLERDHHLDGFTIVHRRVAIGDAVEVRDAIEHQAWLDSAVQQRPA